MLDSRVLVEAYKRSTDWRVKENASAPPSYGAMCKYLQAEVQKDYWLRQVYTKSITDAYREGFIHIHDLGGLTGYCAGYSLRTIIERGVDVKCNAPKSKPAKHFGALLNQITNLATQFQNEIMGAVAFSSVDTLLAPFVKEDQLTYTQIKQHIQNFVFSLNSNARMGAEPAFTNATFDITVPADLQNQPAIVGGVAMNYTYKACQREMNLINKAFCEVMLEGDRDGVPFEYPIPTYNMHKDFDWDNPNNALLWEMAGKIGTPYFANYINSDMKPEDARSMCCRLRLDKRELLKRNGGLFGSGDSTGSIGVVTINLPRLAYLADDPDEFFALLDQYMVLSSESLEIKRNYLQEEVLDKHQTPFFESYIGSYNNFFSTIGYVGLNEACVNLLSRGIITEEGHKFAVEVLTFMRDRLSDFQVQTGNLYNLEATPAESTCYRLARLDKEMLPGIFTQGTDETPYYTNSCHIPVNQIQDIISTVECQDDLQVLHTGGTVIHFYLAGPISGDNAKHIIQTVCKNYRSPYFSLSPVNCVCPEHGLLPGTYEHCPHCNAATELYQRITGYRRKVSCFNDGKLQEFKDRHQLDGNAPLHNV